MKALLGAVLCVLGVLGSDRPCLAQWRAAGTFSVTAYCGCEKCCGAWSEERGANQRTASGTRPRFGIVAADWSVLPKNSLVRIDGLLELRFIVEDTGRAIRGRCLDIYLPHHDMALRWGRRLLKVWVWQPPERDRDVIAGLADVGDSAEKGVEGLMEIIDGSF